MVNAWLVRKNMHNLYIYIYIYIYIKLKENSIKFQIGIQLESNFAPHVPSNLIF